MIAEAEIIRGAPIAGALRRQCVEAIEQAQLTPHLLNIVAGDLGASGSYLDALDRAAERRGIQSSRVHLPDTASEDEVCEAVRKAGADPKVHGLMIQFPLPKNVDRRAVCELIPPHKDVDGLTSASLGHVLGGDRRHTGPATAAAVIEILGLDERLKPEGKHVVVIGRSLTVGRPLAAMLAAPGWGGNATVSLLNRHTADLPKHTRAADIVVVATGAKHLLRADMLRPGAIVVDVGTHVVTDEQGRETLTGDVHPDVAQVAGFLTPVPGGVGVVTTAILMRHVTAAALPGQLMPAW
ncbi:MAG: bifunctional protein FolD [Planctomycetota bacterium]|nr:MAG: bifunctional protein FolD [Planctomycetota bacterium]